MKKKLDAIVNYMLAFGAGGEKWIRLRENERYGEIENDGVEEKQNQVKHMFIIFILFSRCFFFVIYTYLMTIVIYYKIYFFLLCCLANCKSQFDDVYIYAQNGKNYFNGFNRIT